jgi:hypothetical protein
LASIVVHGVLELLGDLPALAAQFSLPGEAQEPELADVVAGLVTAEGGADDPVEAIVDVVLVVASVMQLAVDTADDAHLDAVLVAVVECKVSLIIELLVSAMFKSVLRTVIAAAAVVEDVTKVLVLEVRTLGRRRCLWLWGFPRRCGWRAHS